MYGTVFTLSVAQMGGAEASLAGLLVSLQMSCSDWWICVSFDAQVLEGRTQQNRLSP